MEATCGGQKNIHPADIMWGLIRIELIRIEKDLLPDTMSYHAIQANLLAQWLIQNKCSLDIFYSY